MAHQSKVMWWQCVEATYGTHKFRRWLLYLGHPDDQDSECFFELPDDDYRQVIKGLPPFEAGAMVPARMAFIPARAPKRGKLKEWKKPVKFSEEQNDGSQGSTRVRKKRKRVASKDEDQAV